HALASLPALRRAGRIDPLSERAVAVGAAPARPAPDDPWIERACKGFYRLGEEALDAGRLDGQLEDVAAATQAQLEDGSRASRPDRSVERTAVERLDAVHRFDHVAGSDAGGLGR